jgi:SAM-dependent methyltransferase
VNNRKDVISITRDTYDLIATPYSDKISGLVSDTWVGDYEKQLLDIFLQLIEVLNPKILDVGCGNGKDTAYLMAKGANSCWHRLLIQDVTRGKEACTGWCLSFNGYEKS